MRGHSSASFGLGDVDVLRWNGERAESVRDRLRFVGVGGDGNCACDGVDEGLDALGVSRRGNGILISVYSGLS